MNGLRKWLLCVLWQFAVGWVLLGMRGGKRKFADLYLKHLIVQILLLFYWLGAISLIALWLFRRGALMPLLYTERTLVVFIICYSAALSVFDIPNFVQECRQLNEVIKQLNPLRVFIAAPLRRIRRAWAEWRLS